MFHILITWKWFMTLIKLSWITKEYLMSTRNHHKEISEKMENGQCDERKKPPEEKDT